MNIFFLIYIAAVSLLAVILTVLDKNAARENTRRIKERTLLAVSILGGSAAMLITMLAARYKTGLKFMVGMPLIILIQVVIIAFAFNSSLSVGYYDVETDKINGQIRLALIADLHSCDYGDGQIDLISAIDAQLPDAVLLCGDIFDDDLPSEKTIEFIKDVSDKYPCYYVSGNHEFWSFNADEFNPDISYRFYRCCAIRHIYCVALVWAPRHIV